MTVIFERMFANQTRHPIRWLTAIAFLLALQISPDWLPTPDANAYLSIARSIATRHQLLMLGYADMAYPPGYPLLVSPAFLVAPRPFFTISVIQWLLAIAFMVGLYKWSIRQTPEAGLLVTILVLVNVTLWIYYRRALSEVAFMAVSIWGVLFLDRALESTRFRQRIFNTVVGTLLLVFLTLIREVGVLFGAALLMSICLRVCTRRLMARTAAWMAAIVFFPVFATLVGFVLCSQLTFARTHVFGTHLSGLLDSRVSFFDRVVDGVRLQIYAIGRLMVPGMFKAYGHRWLDANSLVYVPVCVALALGWKRWVVHRYDVYALVLPFYLLVYAIWDFDADTRYLLPILPLLAISLWYLIEPLKSYRLTVLAALICLHLFVALGYWATVELREAQRCNSQWAPISVLAAAVENRPEEIAAVVGVPQCARLMFSFLLDRPVYDLRIYPSEMSRADWLLQRSNQPVVQGFEREHTDDGYALSLRKPPIARR